jgi:hypothetical protein
MSQLSLFRDSYDWFLWPRCCANTSLGSVLTDDRALRANKVRQPEANFNRHCTRRHQMKHATIGTADRAYYRDNV